MATAAGEIFKEINALMRDVHKMTDGQIEVTLAEEPGVQDVTDNDNEDYDDEEVVATLLLSVCPNGGLFKGARVKFKVAVLESYPETSPKIKCLNNIYHPNINLVEDGGMICVNLLDDDWNSDVGLDGTLNALLFLFHQPNGDDPLSGVWSSARNLNADEIATNTRLAIEGETVNGVKFDRLLGEAEEDLDNEDSKGEIQEGDYWDTTLMDEVGESEVKDQIGDKIVEKVEGTEVAETDKKDNVEEAIITDSGKDRAVDINCQTEDNASSANMKRTNDDTHEFETDFEQNAADACSASNHRHNSSSGVDPINHRLGHDTTNTYIAPDVGPKPQELGSRSLTLVGIVAKFTIFRLLACLTYPFSKER